MDRPRKPDIPIHVLPLQGNSNESAPSFAGEKSALAPFSRRLGFSTPKLDGPVAPAFALLKYSKCGGHAESGCAPYPRSIFVVTV